ncbi:hypothetical protein ACSFB8_03115 [Enterococcus faecalis]
MVTEKSCWKLSDNAYWLEPRLKAFDSTLKVGAIRNLDDKQFKIVTIKTDDTIGFQAMAAAPFQKEAIDTSELIIVYAGTTAGIFTEMATNQAVTADYRKWEDTIALKQLQAAQDFAAKVKQAYPQAEIITTGHSLGAFLALYVAAENQWAMVGFNGPDPYEYLTEPAKKWINNQAEMLKNYCNVNDAISHINGIPSGTQLSVKFGGTKNTLAAHQLSLWSILMDSSGQIILPDAELFSGELMKQRVNLYAKMSRLERLKKIAYTESSNSVAEIFFYSAEVLTILTNITNAVEVSIAEMLQRCHKGIDNIQALWTDGLTRARGIGKDLAEPEILEALAQGGITYDHLVEKPTLLYLKKIHEIHKIQFCYSDVIVTIRSALQKLAQTDARIAANLKALNL